MGLKVHVLKIQEMESIGRGPGLRAWPLARQEIGSACLTTGITEFQDGAAIDVHAHNCQEQVTILEGSAIAEIDGHEYALTAPDTTFVPAGVAHRFYNQSGKPMKILWVYDSLAVKRTFLESGKTEAHWSQEK
jgi:putative monooxygenase